MSSLRFTVINSKSFPVQWPVRTGNHAVNSPTRQTRFHGMLALTLVTTMTNDGSGHGLMTSLAEGTDMHYAFTNTRPHLLRM